MTISPVIPTYNRADFKLERGEGVYLYDDSGNKYLDFLSGIAVNALGHSHPALIKTLEEQGRKLWHTSNIFLTEPLEKLSKRLTELTFADSVFFCNSGAEAVECGLKAARRYFYEQGKPEKNRFITFDGAFHGRTFGAIAATGSEKALEGFEPRLPGFDKIAVDLEVVKQTISNQTAAILVEPIQGEGGIMPLPNGFLSDLRKICDDNDILLFVDEIQCGVGRSGKLFAYEYCGIEPDIMSVAKGLGGGFPIGACLMKEKVAECLKVGTHGTTFGGNPLATAIGNTILDIVATDEFLAHVKKMGKYLEAKSEALCKEFPEIVQEVRGHGLMRGLKIQDDYLNLDIVVAARKKGLIINGAGQNVVRFLPPLIIEEKHVDEAFEKLHSALSEM